MFPDTSFKNESSIYPIAYKPQKVGKYPGFVNSGGGCFYDEALEYRVWIHPENGGKDLFNGDDYFYAFVSYEEAQNFSEENQGADEPLVLIFQKEWINEPQPGKYIHLKGKRYAEWQVEWLKSGKRNKDSISNFLKAKQTFDR